MRPGLGLGQVAVVMKNLMNRLGFKKYYVQGGDWGAGIVSAMSTLYPEEILGHHSNMAGVWVKSYFILLVVLMLQMVETVLEISTSLGTACSGTTSYMYQ